MIIIARAADYALGLLRRSCVLGARGWGGGRTHGGMTPHRFSKPISIHRVAIPSKYIIRVLAGGAPPASTFGCG